MMRKVSIDAGNDANRIRNTAHNAHEVDGGLKGAGEDTCAGQE